MKIQVIKRDLGFTGATAIDQNSIDGIANGTLLTIEIRKQRNAKFHRRFFALMSWVMDSQEKWDTVDQLLIEMKVKLGLYELYVTEDGEAVFIPKSISFSNMDQVEFEAFYSQAVDIVLRDYMPVDKKELEIAVNRILNFI